MPSNKEAFIRYRAINRCLINKGLATREDLIRACSEATSHDVSWRTIAEDIRAMRQDEVLGFEAPIENVVNQGYRYSDPAYSIDRIPLKDEELRSLQFAARLFQEYSQVGIFTTFSGAVERLSQKVAIRLQEGSESGLGKIIEFESTTSDGGSGLVDDFIECIRHRIVVRIAYVSFSSGSRSNPRIHPYFLKEYRNRWYLIGWHEDHGAIRTLALERIESVERDYGASYRVEQFDPARYYEHAIGVSVNDSEPVHALIRVDKREWPYIQTQPWHSSQQLVRENEGSVEFSLHIIVNFEFKSLLLSYGKRIEVLEPADLRRDIRRELGEAFESYSENN
ncbi:MAG: WYL domain-containing protein [Flavobacteriales bacterium]|nr:WYL domain-containing protein [Flavobacteriales bacterium]